MNIDAQDLDGESSYKLLIGSIIPRPIAWVSTLSTDGVANLAPISFFTCVGRKPPMVSLSIQARADGVTRKDTFTNIKETGEFVTNMATLPQSLAVNRSAIEFAPDEDEFEMVNAEKEPSVMVKPYRVKGSPIALECKVAQFFEAPDGLAGIVWGEVVNFFIRDDLYVNGRVDFGAIAPIGRLAAEYSVVNNTFVPPLDPEVLAEYANKRMVRLDGKGEEYSPINTGTWSASGSVIE